MDFAQLVNEVKSKSDDEAIIIAKQYGIDFSKTEIRALRPLLDEISFHWLFTGIPETFITKIRGAIGDKKTDVLFKKYLDSIK
ncbi:hypothetical protein [Sporosarcina sp. E16_8]|uniref:hypothetical protein n=1 Tax=Sporosarcina sp. E16_8 TaxID=2789295 RepID=UPI001A92D085|nr:hypothetical protein [Sporosarcina sp. E16_8]MBO0586516.1 hypothetical protein [Sporosarcina sp. E16_8]